MSEMSLVDDVNQDDMSRKAGCYLYVGTKIWLDGDLVHRTDGPAVVFPDGVVRWYLRGKERTREVNMFFYENKWPVAKGLDTDEKLRKFAERFGG